MSALVNFPAGKFGSEVSCAKLLVFAIFSSLASFTASISTANSALETFKLTTDATREVCIVMTSAAIAVCAAASPAPIIFSFLRFLF